MSVTEIGSRGEEFERTPPHDVAAEQCVLGGMLLSKDAISDVIEVIRPSDHYRPAHQIVHEAILDLYARGEPADAITVGNELARRNELGKIGGGPYLHTLIASVPTAANAGYYARIVRERAILRRLVEAGTRIVQFGYAGDGDADELVDRAQAEVYAVTDRRISEDYHSLSEIMPGALDEIEAIGSHGGAITGVPTGFADLDTLTNGLHAGQMIVIAARPAIGKALALDTPLVTPDGWTTMGEVQVGDHLIGGDGRATRVLAATDVMYGRPCYEVTFDDGTVVVADAEHQWKTTTSTRLRQLAGAAIGEPDRLMTTSELAADLGRQVNHRVAAAAALSLAARQLPLSPYVLGVDPAIDRIPAVYLRASEDQRRALLAGLLDLNGTVSPTGAVQLSVTSQRLAREIRELVVSLGYRCNYWKTRVPRKKPTSFIGYTITFTTSDDVFRLTRKATMHRERRPARQMTREHAITAVRPVASVPVRCVQVDAADHLYLASESMIPTHNSSLALDFARAATIKNQLPTVVFSLEMGRNEITMRLLSAESRVPLSTMRTGQMSDDDWARLARRMSEVADAPLFIDDSPNMSLMEIRAKCRRLKQRHDLKMVIIDYLQLMSSPKRVESRQQEVSEMSRSLKLLAKELEVPVVALSQLNRGPEQRTDKRPMLSDLRESGCVTSDTTLLRADTGAPVSFAELLRDGWEGVSVWSLDEQQKLVAAPLTNVFESGIKEVYRIRLASGREVKASANHPFLTFGGWTRLDQLALGDRVGIARRVPEPIGVGLGWSKDRLGSLARRLGDCLPIELYSASDEELRVFLRHLWTTDGSDRLSRLDCPVYYAASSREVADGVAVLLARLGIVALVRRAGEPGFPSAYHVIVAARDLASALDEAPALSGVHEGDVYWDQVMVIESLGPQPVYDATVKETHNFVANGINLHNSIEQDADVVILLHREDAYERESPRAGEADLIVAKHRNGPTATVTVAFQGHYSRFVDMAPG